MGILKLKTLFSLFAALCAACIFVSCTNFMPDTFARIDANKLRVIGVVVGPHPEVLPGDTVTVTAFFGGNQVLSLGNVRLAFGYIGDRDGITFIDTQIVNLQNQPVGLPDSARFSFIVKPDVFLERSPYWTFFQSTVDSVSRLFMKDKDSVATMISSLSDSQKVSLGKIIDKMVLQPTLIFTAYSANGTALDVGAQFTIKYHADLSGVTHPNNNPDISWVGICKVPSAYALGFSYFDPSNSGKYSMTYLYNKNSPALCDSVIDVDIGYAYFLVADNGISAKTDPKGQTVVDTAWDFIIDEYGNRFYETYNYKWFYQNVNDVTDQDSLLMQIDDNGSACTEMKPPFDTDMKTFRAWVAAYDQIKPQQMQPRGMCVRAVQGVFRFSPQYVKEMKTQK
jgi:hypothetical protein